MGPTSIMFELVVNARRLRNSKFKLCGAKRKFENWDLHAKLGAIEIT
jgi:hypothetical protein